MSRRRGRGRDERRRDASAGPPALDRRLRLGPEVAAAALVPGSCFGVDPPDPDSRNVQSIAGTTGIQSQDLDARVAPASPTGLIGPEMEP
jgi:hypothetical protein